MSSIGIIDTVGFVGSVNALDTCLKTADVEFVRFEKMSGGIVAIVIKGDIAAVSASIAAGIEAAKLVGEYRKHTIVARLDDQTEKVLSKSNLSRDDGVNRVPAFIGNEIDSFEDSVKSEEKLSTVLDPSDIVDVHETLSKIEGENKEEAIAQMLNGDAEKTGDHLSTVVLNNKGLTFSEESLNLMTVSRLRKIAREMNLKGISREKIKRSRKFDLVANILNELKEEEE
ncbi:MAG: hypothetical protein CVU99_05925 [Firmicutes bacterium HGW-Firmicutes-4]|jgi:microcompartment protein CcmL/EutN|nr:MAG: hypothetical protein CVU99_05925 [Firmicutes bacterium HGW-Firmicutes-4]